MRRNFSPFIIIALALALGITYNFWTESKQQEAIRVNTALLEAQYAEPPRSRSFVVDGHTWYEKCEQGWCMQATDLKSLEGPIVREASGGFPTINISALSQMVEGTRSNSEGKNDSL